MRFGAFFNNMIQFFWDNVQGQDKAKENLLKIFNSGKIPHAFIFSGPDGVGKFNLALRFSLLLNQASSGNTIDPTIEKRILQLQEPYIKYIIPLPRGKNETGESSATEKLDKGQMEILLEEFGKKIENPFYRISIPGANGIKVTSIREIRKFLSYNFDEVKYRIILISEAHLMNEESQNALLKNLEEPPSGVIFILLTSRIDQLRETILSRCWKINCESLPQQIIKDILISKFGFDKKTAELSSKFSNGSIIRALDLIENNIDEMLGKTIQILRLSLGMKYHSALKEINDIVTGNNRDKLLLLLNLISLWINDVIKNRVDINEFYYQDYIDTIEKFNQGFIKSNIAYLDTKINRLAASLENNVNLNVIALNLIFELASLRH